MRKANSRTYVFCLGDKEARLVYIQLKYSERLANGQWKYKNTSNFTVRGARLATIEEIVQTALEIA